MQTKKILLWLGILTIAGVILSVFAESITSITLVPNLDISRFASYTLEAEFSWEAISWTVDIAWINGDGTECRNYYASGDCYTHTGLNFPLVLSWGTGTTWIKTWIRPDHIYPEIFFAPNETFRYNTPSEIAMNRSNYEILHFDNPFTMEGSMSFFIELNIAPRSIANSVNLNAYLIKKDTPLSFFQSNRLSSTGVELVASFSRTSTENHSHTSNSSHYLIALTTNADGTIGSWHLDVSSDFWIVLSANTTTPSKWRYLRYLPSSICTNTNAWYVGNYDTWNTSLQAGCPDSHIHIARRDTPIQDGMTARINMTYLSWTITGSQDFYFGMLPNLRPNATSFITPTSGSYTGDINISRYPASDANNDSLTYNIYLTDISGNTIHTIATGISSTNYLRDSTITGEIYTGDGTYNLKWEACDTSLCSTFNLEENFIIDNNEDPDTTPPTFNITSGQYFSGNVNVKITDENYSGTIVTYSWSDTTYTSTGFTLTGEGYYFLTAYDTTGNNNSIGFFIDRASPTFTGVISGTTYYTGVIIEFFDNNDWVTATLSGWWYTGWSYTSGTLITATGIYLFVVTDSAGNTTGATFTIEEADTTVPTGYITYDISTPTSGDVIATLTGLSEPVTVTNNSWSIYYTFTESGSFTFQFQDSFGNTGEATATVTWIDKTIPIVALNWTATIYIEFGNDYIESWAIWSDNWTTGDAIIIGSVDTGTIGTYTLEYLYFDGVQTGSTTRTIYVQDTQPPTATIEYTPTSWVRTTGDVIAILTGFSESVTISNNGWSWIYLFTASGSFTFQFQDSGGNTGEATATVNRIDKTAPIVISTGTITTTTGTATISSISITEDGAGLASAYMEYSWVANSITNWNLQLSTGDLNNLTWFIAGLDHNATYFYMITFTDTIGNSSFITWTFETIIDRNIIYTEVRSGNILSGIENNLSTVTNDNVLSFTWLYLEIPSIGKIEIQTGINLTDPWTQTFLQSLGQNMIMENGYINFIVHDTSTESGSAFKDIPATLTMWLTEAQYPNGTGSVDNIVVKDNNWTIIESSSILSNFFCTGSILTGIEQECSFNTLHFTSFGTKPTLTTVNISSSNTNPWYAKIGDIITLSFTGSEDLTWVSGIIASTGVIISWTGTDRTWSIMLAGGEPEGIVNFSIDFEDFYTNTGVTVTTVTDTSQIIIDLTAPTITNITTGQYFSGNITPNIIETNYSWATLNGVDYTSGTAITGEDAYELIVYDLAGNSFAVTFTIDKTEPTFSGVISWAYYTGSMTLTFSDSGTLNGAPIPSGYTTSADGTYILTITDPAMNSTGATFTIDNTLPQISNITSGQRFSGNVTPTIVETNYSWTTLNGAAYSSGTAITTDGTYELIIYDLAGNSYAVTFSIDKTQPSLTGTTTFSSNNTTNSGYAKTNDIITVIFTSQETLNTTPTITISWASYTGTVTNIGGNTYSWTYTMRNTDTQWTIGFNILMTDLVGNTGSVHVASTIIFDRTAPAGITFTNPTATSYRQNQTGSAYRIIGRTTGSEMNFGPMPLQIQFSTNGFWWITIISTWTNNDWTFDRTVNSIDTSSAQIRIIATDLAGNQTTITSAAFIIDSTAPTAPTITYPIGWEYLKWGNTYIITRTWGYDDNLSWTILEISTDGWMTKSILTGLIGSPNSYVRTPATTINSNAVRLGIYLQDKWLLTSSHSRILNNFIVDSIKPTLTFADTLSWRRNTNATWIVTTIDTWAWVANTGIFYRTDTAFTGICDGGTNTPPTFTTEGYRTGYACVIDRVGNIRTGQQSYKIDKTAPLLTMPANIITNTGATINITVTGDISWISWYTRSMLSWPTSGTIVFSGQTAQDPFVTGSGDGDYILQVLVRDNANNITTWTIHFYRNTTAPIITTGTVTNLTSKTPTFTFTASNSGTLSRSWACSSSTTTAISWSNSLTLSTLSNATYSTCQIRIKDSMNNTWPRFNLPTFTVNYSAWGGGWWGGWGWGGWGSISTCTTSQLVCSNGLRALATGASCYGWNLWTSCGTDICVDGDYSGDPSDGLCEDQTKVEAGKGTTGTWITYISPYNRELTDAYSYAYGIKITTVSKIEWADMTWVLIRSHLSKMMSEYAMKVLGKKPDTTKKCVFTDMSNQTEEFKKYAILACQLGLMGLKTDGTPAKTFDPNDQVNRAIFGTTLSRALRWETYNGGQNRYIKHLEALKAKGIMNKIQQPFNRELRGYVMLMMMRADSTTTKSNYLKFTPLRWSKIFVPKTTTVTTNSSFTTAELDFIKSINKSYQFSVGYTAGESDIWVKYLQYFLKTKKYYTWAINGINTTATVAALFQFQLDKGIVDDENDQWAGYLGPTTREIINPLLKIVLNP